MRERVTKLLRASFLSHTEYRNTGALKFMSLPITRREYTSVDDGAHVITYYYHPYGSYGPYKTCVICGVLQAQDAMYRVIMVRRVPITARDIIHYVWTPTNAEGWKETFSYFHPDNDETPSPHPQYRQHNYTGYACCQAHAEAALSLSPWRSFENNTNTDTNTVSP